MPDDSVIRLGGRAFRPVLDATIEHDYWMMGRIRLAGIDRVVIEDGELPEEFAVRLLRELVNSGEIFAILGGAIMPADRDVCDWTPEMAADTSTFLKRLTAAEDKQTINSVTASLLAGFFAHGLATLLTSRSYSSEKLASPSPNSAGVDTVH